MNSEQPAPARPSTDRDDDRSLLERLQGGDESAFEELLRSQGGRLLAVARRLLRNDADARDALQDAMVAAVRALRTFRGDSQLSTWLHRIVVNAALMKLRSRRRTPETSIEPLLPAFASDGHHRRSWQREPDAERMLLDREKRAAVRQGIDRLPDTYRTVLLLRDIEGLDTDTVAGMLQVSPNAVKIRLHRARLALVTLLSPGRQPAGDAPALGASAQAPGRIAPAPRLVAAQPRLQARG